MDLLANVVVEIIGGSFKVLFYWIGWLFLKILTFGNYPPQQTIAHNRFAVALFGAIVVLIVIVALL